MDNHGLFSHSKGYAVAEALISLGLGVVFLSCVMGAWYFSSRVWGQGNVQAALRYGVETSIERMKADVRLSDSTKILYYPPSSSGPYSAISIPVSGLDASGFSSNYDATNNKITWNRTVIYHVFQNGTNKELRRTVYDSFIGDNASRQTQLNSLVSNGSDSANATTFTLCSADTINLEINSSTPIFDGYSPTVTLSDQTDFGNIRLTSGLHRVKFLVTDQNIASTGMGMGIDSIMLSPSGGSQEVEMLPIQGSSGAYTAHANMAAYGGWGGNYHVEYQSASVGDYITFQTSYDQWFETNFGDMTHSNTAVVHDNPALTIMNRENQGRNPSWSAEKQAQGVFSQNEILSHHQSIRIVMDGNYLIKPGQMIRIKLMSASDEHLVIHEAYFGVRDGLTANFLGLPTSYPLYFDNAPVLEGNLDPPGHVSPPDYTTGPVTIPANSHLYSNWFEYNIPTVPTATNFLVSLYVTSGSAMIWDDIISSPEPTHSYLVDGNHAADATLWETLTTENFQASKKIYAVTELATWSKTGVANSQVYDTKITSPTYDQLSWSSVLPASSSLSLKVRTADSASMNSASDWSAAPVFTSSPASLGGIPALRYIQFQATLQAASPYTAYPELDNVKITWPGQTAVVNVSGRYTRKPDYGKFQVLVDDVSLVKALTIAVSVTKNFQRLLQPISEPKIPESSEGGALCV